MTLRKYLFYQGPSSNLPYSAPDKCMPEAQPSTCELTCIWAKVSRVPCFACCSSCTAGCSLRLHSQPAAGGKAQAAEPRDVHICELETKFCIAQEAHLLCFHVLNIPNSGSQVRW